MQVIIMRGIPGSGKSTWMINNYPKDFCRCSADAFFEMGQDYRFDPQKLPEAHDYCLRLFISRLSGAMDEVLIVDNTNIRAWEIAPYHRLAEIHKVPVKIVRCVCNPLTAIKRNTHNVPAKLILQMHQWLNKETLPPWWNEEIHITE